MPNWQISYHRNCHRKPVNYTWKWHLWTADNFTNIQLNSHFSTTLIGGLLMVWGYYKERYDLIKCGSGENDGYVETLPKVLPKSM